jgi:Ni,Fe-hydrogenase III component G
MRKQRTTVDLRGSLIGERALIAAVIARAVRDATGTNAEHKVDARRYFLSDVYDMHLSALGISRDALPVALISKENAR